MSGHTVLPARKQRLVLVIIAFAVFMASLDSTIVNISRPSIAKSFDADLGMISWVSLPYLLALAGFLLIIGRFADLKGFRKVFITGFVIFTIGSLACGLSATLNQLIAFRALQGIG
jgi:MFS family permease